MKQLIFTFLLGLLVTIYLVACVTMLLDAMKIEALFWVVITLALNVILVRCLVSLFLVFITKLKEYINDKP